MGRSTSSPERSGRLYFNESYDDNPAAAPIALRAISAAFTRRTALLQAANRTLRDIDRALNGEGSGPNATPPPAEQHGIEPEEELEPQPKGQRRKLGQLAMVEEPVEEKIA